MNPSIDPANMRAIPNAACSELARLPVHPIFGKIRSNRQVGCKWTLYSFSYLNTKRFSLPEGLLLLFYTECFLISLSCCFFQALWVSPSPPASFCNAEMNINSSLSAFYTSNSVMDSIFLGFLVTVLIWRDANFSVACHFLDAAGAFMWLGIWGYKYR